ncbi:MAG: hemolysin III family protein [Opitutus sp.]|nr:hemolysin III family protein [Opitutus sp.]
MSEPTAGSPKEPEPFSLPYFVFLMTVTLAGLGGLLKLVAPDAVWLAQVSASLGLFVAAFLTVMMVNCFVEYVFHRYVLHKPVVPILSQFYRQHTLHHNLTRIGRRRTPGGREVPFVENIYPITAPEQSEASFFPWYTFTIFAALATPFLALAQWLAPTFPWFFAGYLALAGSISLYEISHAIEHWSFEKWGPLIEHPRLGWFWRKVYSFHLRHHAVIDCNEAISGFFTLPVADWVFGTFILPKNLYADGAEWIPSEFTSPRPYAFIRWCDERSDAIVKNRREAAASAPAATTTTYSRGEQIAHYFTHGTGLAASVTALVLLAVFAGLRGETRHVMSAVVFGVALVLLYATFISFRRERPAVSRPRFHKYNHAAVFLLIAGTATPFLLGNVRGPWGWSLFGVVWGLCLIGALSRLLFGDRMRGGSTFAYLALAVLALIAIKPLLATVPAGALWLLLLGGLCYVGGTVFHLWQHVRYHQVVRHAFAIGGSACHLLAVLLFVLPGRS